MSVTDAFMEMVETCVANHDAIMQHGSPEMQTASRMLLYALADEIRRREADEPTGHDEA